MERRRGPHEEIMHANQLRTFKELGISRLLFVLGERRQPASFCVRGRHQPLAALGVRPHFCLKIVYNKNWKSVLKRGKG